MTPEMLLATTLSSKEKKANSALARPPMPSLATPAGGGGSPTAMRPPTMGGTGPAMPAAPSSAGTMRPRSIPKMASVQQACQKLQKKADMVKRSTEKTAQARFEKTAIPGMAMAGNAIKGIMRASTGTRAAYGAAGGAALGAARYAMSNDPNKSLAGSMLGGAALGAGAGAGARHAIGFMRQNSQTARQFMQKSRQAAKTARTAAPAAAGAAANPAAFPLA